MPLPTPIGGTPYRVSFKFNWTENGWSENYYAVANEGTDGMTSVFYAAVLMSPIRRKILSTSAKLVGITVSDLTTGRISTIGKSVSHGIGNGFDPAAPLPKGSCLWVRGQDTTYAYDEMRPYRGITEDTVAVGQIPKTNPDPTPKITKWVGEMRDYLAKTHDVPADQGGSSVRFGLGSNDRRASENPILKVTAVTLDNDRRLQILTPDDATSIVIGTKVHLSVNRSRCARGVSGRYVVRDKDTATTPGVTRITLNKSFCCSISDLLPLFGTVQRLGRATYGYRWFDFASIGHRNTGRAYFATRGRRQSRCC